MATFTAVLVQVQSRAPKFILKSPIWAFFGFARPIDALRPKKTSTKYSQIKTPCKLQGVVKREGCAQSGLPLRAGFMTVVYVVDVNDSESQFFKLCHQAEPWRGYDL